MSAYPNEQQVEKMLYTLENNIDQLHGKFSSTVTKKTKDALWDNIANDLNIVPNGCNKTSEEWRKVIQILYFSYIVCVYKLLNYEFKSGLIPWIF